MLRSKLQMILMSLWMGVLLGGPVLGQADDPGRFGDLVFSEVFRAARYYSENNFYDQALQEYERVAEENPGGDLEATARLLLADQYFEIAIFRPGDDASLAQLLEKGRAQLDLVIQRFPGTRYAWVAEVMKIEGFGEYDWQRVQLDPLISSVGGLTFTEILGDNPPPFHERMILEEYRADVAEVYSTQVVGLSGEQEDKMVIFLIESFPYTNWRIHWGRDHFSKGLIPPTMSVDGVPPGMPNEPDTQAPTILSRFPEPGAVTGLFPEIRVTMVDGDYWASQPSMEKSRLKLDGVDITPLAFWKVKFDPTGTLPNFEEVTILYTPIVPLSLGQHTLELLAVDNKGLPGEENSATYTWTFIVDPNAGFDPTSETLPATKDTTIYDRGPHKNEGANPRLLLKKVQGKPAQFLVGFDTTNVNTNGLTKATLVLTIDSSQNVTGWGNGGPIRARRVLTDWVEGNGKSLELSKNQQSIGSGAGATWFSPIDANISNNQADSAITWSGAQSFTAPSTAPTVTIKNHQSGEVTFDVTEDLLLGAEHGWLVTRDQDVGSQVAFHSRETGAATAPHLVLEYGLTVTAKPLQSLPFGLPLLASLRSYPVTTGSAVLSEGRRFFSSLLAGEPMVAPSATVTLKPLEVSPEARPGFRQALRQNPALATAGEQPLGTIAGPNPIAKGLATTAYRGWLELG